MQRLQAKKLTISAKSTITSSRQSISLELQELLKQDGVSIQVDDSAKDLGVDFCGGRRRLIPVPDASSAVAHCTLDLRDAAQGCWKGLCKRAWARPF